MRRSSVTRRSFVAGSAASAALLAAPYVRTAHAAGSLAVWMWDHWVRRATAAMEASRQTWAEKGKVDVKVDLITSQGNKLVLTVAAEAQAKAGHDVIHLPSWLTSRNAELLEPVDDVVADLIKANGDVSTVSRYLALIKGSW